MDLARAYQEIVETSADGIWVIDLDGRTLYANATLADMLGFPLDEMPGVTVFDTLDEVGRGQFAAHLEDVRRGIANTGEVETQVVRRDGEVRWVTVSERLLRAEDGSVESVLHRFTDITESRATLEALQRSRAHLLEAQRIARVGSWTIDLDTGVLEASEGLRFLVGLPEGAPPASLDAVMEVVHPDDHQLLRHELDVATRRDEHTFGMRLRRPDDGWMSVRVRARPTGGPGCRRLTGGILDVTETVEAQAGLQDQVAQNVLMEAIAAAANDASTMRDVLGMTRHLVVLHDDWCRARGFLLEDGVLAPAYVFDDEVTGDQDDPEQLQREWDLVRRAVVTGEPAWSEDLLMIAGPVLLGAEVVGVFVLTATEPCVRLSMVEDMVRQAAALVSRVAERERAASELARARDDAMAASRQKSDFLAMVSHEIRTPLNGVLGLNELLLGTDLDDEQRRMAAGIELSGRTLLRLINDILDFSKFEAGRLELEQVDFDIRAIVRQATEPHVSAGEAKGLEVEVVVGDVVPEVLNGDPTRYAQVLGNLVSNAVKFTESGQVRVRVTGGDCGASRSLRTEVADTGIGIGVDRSALFEPFRQADLSTTRLYGGTGLGLAICQELVHALGGEIDVESVVGEGTRFWFTGSFSPSVGGVVQGRISQREESSAPMPFESTRVLVVEDHPVNQMVAVGMLESLGCDVAVADDGAAALLELDRSAYDLVLMDVHMPGLDGYETTRRIRAGETAAGQGVRVPIVAMTASAVEGERGRCLDSGMDDLLTKPVDPRELRRAVTGWTQPVGEPGTDDTTDETSSDAPTDAPTRETTVSEALDLDRLRTLEETAPGYVARVAGRMQERLPRDLEAIRVALDGGDAAATRSAAHHLAGGAGNVGLATVERIAREMEARAEAGRLVETAAMLDRLEVACSEGNAALTAHVAGSGD